MGQGQPAKVRIGIVGCGYWGPKLARNIHQLPDAELAWVCDLNTERLEHMRQLYPQAEATRDYREVLAADVEAVIIATPVATHHPLAMEALLAGKSVLVEKPLATTTELAAEIAATADRLGLVAMVGHTFQHNPAVNVVRSLIEAGELGEVYYVSTTRVNLGLFQRDVNVMWDLAPHDISILLHILRQEPLAVSATGEAYVQRARGIHDVAYLTVRFGGGTLANIQVSWLDPVKQRRITIVGSRKMLVYDDIADDKVIVYDKGVEVPPYSDTPEEFHMSYRHGLATVVPLVWQEPLHVECRAFVDWLRTGIPSCSGAWVGARVVSVLEAAQRSLLNGGGREVIAP